MIVTVLIENNQKDEKSHLIAEHGLSLHVSTNGEEILFDMGASDAFSKNASAMGLDLGKVDAAVLSHHHFDHGGGLGRFISLNTNAKIHLKDPPDGDCTFKALLVLNRYIGLDRNLIEAHADRFSLMNDFTEILPDVYILTNIMNSYAKPKSNRYLYVKKDKSIRLDNFAHELIMVVQGNDGLVIFTGCSHNGVLNMIDTVARQFAGIPIKAVIGGLHLVGLPMFNSMGGSKREIEDVGMKILGYSIGQIYAGHCTGQKAFKVLKNVMGDRLEPLHTGMVIEV